jgi:hypothetical protein
MNEEQTGYSIEEIASQLKTRSIPDLYGVIETSNELIFLGKSKAFITNYKYGESSGMGNSYTIDKI